MKNLLTEKRFNEIVGKFSEIDPIMILGDVGIDKYTYGRVQRISPEAPVPILEVTKEWPKLGLAANISHNLKTLQIASTLCGVVGDDANAGIFEQLLREQELNTDGIIRVPGRKTVFKERVTTKTQQICRIDYETSERVSCEVEDKYLSKVNTLFPQHSALILEDYSKGMLTERIITETISKCREKKTLVAVDPGRKTPPWYYKGATLLKPNFEEARLMTVQFGHTEERLEAMANILVDKLRLEKLVITLGEHGMALLDTKDDGKVKVIPTVATKVFDVSGAGDTAIALLTAGLVAGASLEEAAWLGNCGSGVVVSKPGTSTVSLEELREFHLKLLNTF